MMLQLFMFFLLLIGDGSNVDVVVFVVTNFVVSSGVFLCCRYVVDIDGYAVVGSVAVMLVLLLMVLLL